MLVSNSTTRTIFIHKVCLIKDLIKMGGGGEGWSGMVEKGITNPFLYWNVVWVAYIVTRSKEPGRLQTCTNTTVGSFRMGPLIKLPRGNPSSDLENTRSEIVSDKRVKTWGPHTWFQSWEWDEKIRASRVIQMRKSISLILGELGGGVEAKWSKGGCLRPKQGEGMFRRRCESRSHSK